MWFTAYSASLHSRLRFLAQGLRSLRSGNEPPQQNGPPGCRDTLCDNVTQGVASLSIEFPDQTKRKNAMAALLSSLALRRRQRTLKARMVE